MEVHHFLTLHRRTNLTEYRRRYSVAHLVATLLNALGGKGDGGSALAASKRFETEEMMAPWMLPDVLTRDLPFTPAQCRAVQAAINAKELPSWAVQMIDQIMPVDKIGRAAGDAPLPNLDDWDTGKSK